VYSRLTRVRKLGMRHRGSLFVTCAKGVEPYLQNELVTLGFHTNQLTNGLRGVTINSIPPESLMPCIFRVNFLSRLATRVLLPIHEFKIFSGKDDLYKRTKEISWTQFIPPNATFAISSRVDASLNEFKSPLYAVQVCKDGIVDRYRMDLGGNRRPNVDTHNPDVHIRLRMIGNDAQIFVDTSLEPLHRRGYRKTSVEAPVQETLAAFVLRLACEESGYQFRGSALCDPCCGSGTFLAEAAMIATNTPPDFRKVKLASTKFAPKLVVTNPPYGKRLDFDTNLKSLYRRLGDFMKNECARPADGWVLTGDTKLSKEVGLKPKTSHILNNGGIESRLLHFDIYSKKKEPNNNIETQNIE
jgi:23S rRNA G2445 N2-methylase RlmL